MQSLIVMMMTLRDSYSAVSWRFASASCGRRRLLRREKLQRMISVKAIANSRPQKTVSTRLKRSITSPELKHDFSVRVSPLFTGVAGCWLRVAPAGFSVEGVNGPEEESGELGLSVWDWFCAFSAAATLILDDLDRKLLLWKTKIEKLAIDNG